MSTQKVREDRLRRMAKRRGYRLIKSRTRDPYGVDFGLYGLIDIEINGTVFPSTCLGSPCSATLDEVEAWLTTD
jgi:hypothetical protein